VLVPALSVGWFEALESRQALPLPLYAGAFWLLVGTPLALGSWWSLGLIVPLMPVLLWRLLDEETILRKDLRGYAEYIQKVRYRLVPFVW
jgi:protein-S-isoprenylcysteine O-methyltransferase Ste14